MYQYERFYLDPLDPQYPLGGWDVEQFVLPNTITSNPTSHELAQQEEKEEDVGFFSPIFDQTTTFYKANNNVIPTTFNTVQFHLKAQANGRMYFFG